MEFGEARLRGCWSGENIAAFLDESAIPARLSVHDSTGSPWVVSLWFLHEEGRLWCATQASARLAAFLAADPRCGFEVAGDQAPYRGVRGKGTAALVPERGAEVLGRLLDRYAIDRASPLARSLLAKADHELAIAITPSHLTSWDFTARMAGAVAG